MAEAAVEDRSHTKFYCHMCNVQFEIVPSNNYTCPHCSDGFIEELSEPHINNDNPILIDDDDDDDDDEDMDLVFTGRGTTTSTPIRTRRSGRRNYRTRMANPRSMVPFENLIQDFIVNLGVGLNWGTAGNLQLFLGNPGDYAWGREGLDAIVTQLLNQMDSTGPPPVSKNVIDALPTVKVDSEQVSAKLQCSVCWEDFVIDENVRQLPCTHIYHELCIRPWLELHGTCPICRQNLQNDEQNNINDTNTFAGDSSLTASSSAAPGASGARHRDWDETIIHAITDIISENRNVRTENNTNSSRPPNNSDSMM